MALDCAAYKDGLASLRFYRWKEPTVSIGRRQSPEEIRPTFPHLPLVSRPTGGGAVLHGFDVTFALVLPLEWLQIDSRHLTTLYRALITPLGEALSRCDLPCTLAENRGSELTHLDCFAGAGRMDLVHRLSHQKVAGSALAVKRDAVLLHGSIPEATPPDSVVSCEETRRRYTNPTWRSADLPAEFVSCLSNVLDVVVIHESAEPGSLSM